MKPAAFLAAPKPNWHLLRTISSDMESGAVNLSRIGRVFGVSSLEAMAEPLLAQWRDAGMLEKRGDWHVQTIAGQYWHVTLAQLLMNWLEPMLPGAMPAHPSASDIGSPDIMRRMREAHAAMRAGRTSSQAEAA